MNLCGPPALKPARHCRNASAAKNIFFYQINGKINIIQINFFELISG